jgi:hypothetical protein
VVDGNNDGSAVVDMGAFEYQHRLKVDFNGDGKTDILWRNQTYGYNMVWLMNGLKVVAEPGLTRFPTPTGRLSAGRGEEF